MSVDFRVPELVTDRLRLRLPKPGDLAAHTRFQSSGRARFVGGPCDAAASFQHLAGIVGQWALRGYGRWMVADRETDAPLGVVGIYHPEDWPEPEIGWSLYAEAEGRGIAAEAAVASRDFAYRTLGWRRIVSLIAPGNVRSVRLAQRLGCVFETSFDHPEFGALDIWVHPPPEASA